MKIKPLKVILDTGVEVEMPRKFEYSKCRGCQARNIIWAKTKSGKNMPIRFDIVKNCWISHFSDCPKADSFRKRNETGI